MMQKYDPTEELKAAQDALGCATCRYADPRTVGTGKPCCTHAGQLSAPRPNGRCGSWRTLANDAEDEMHLVR